MDAHINGEPPQVVSKIRMKRALITGLITLQTTLFLSQFPWNTCRERLVEPGSFLSANTSEY